MSMLMAKTNLVSYQLDDEGEDNCSSHGLAKLCESDAKELQGRQRGGFRCFIHPRVITILGVGQQGSLLT